MEFLPVPGQTASSVELSLWQETEKKINAQAKTSAKYGAQESYAHVQTEGGEPGEGDRRKAPERKAQIVLSGLTYASSVSIPV